MFSCLSLTIRRTSAFVTSPGFSAYLFQWRRIGKIGKKGKELSRSALVKSQSVAPVKISAKDKLEKGKSEEKKGREKNVAKKKETHSKNRADTALKKKGNSKDAFASRHLKADLSARAKEKKKSRETKMATENNKNKRHASPNSFSNTVHQEKSPKGVQKKTIHSLMSTKNKTQEVMGNMDEDDFLKQMGVSKRVVGNKKSSHYQKQMALDTEKPLSFTTTFVGGTKKTDVQKEEDEEYLAELEATSSAVRNASKTQVHSRQNQQDQLSVAPNKKAFPAQVNTLLTEEGCPERSLSSSSFNANTKKNAKAQEEEEEEELRYLERLTVGKSLSFESNKPVGSPVLNEDDAKRDCDVFKSAREEKTDVGSMVSEEDVYFMALMQKEAQLQQRQSDSCTERPEKLIKSEAAGDDEAEADEEEKQNKHRHISAPADGQNGEHSDNSAASGVEELSADQRRAVEFAREGKNLFITGGAGSGKSLVIREIVQCLRKEQNRSVYITATTGVAALNIRGSTINSFAGIKFGDNPVSVLLKWVRRSRKSVFHWRFCDTLIIDEISMMEPELFDKLDHIARTIRRKKDEPFGGMQIILCGDFMQLPPIIVRNKWGNQQQEQQQPQPQRSSAGKSTANDEKSSGADNARHMSYCFETDAWRELGLTTVLLRTIFRQKSDITFQRILDEVRVGELSRDTQKRLRARVVPSAKAPGENREETFGDAEKFVRLCATNKEVDARNAKYFAALEPVGPAPHARRDDDEQPQTQTQKEKDNENENDCRYDDGGALRRPHYVYTALDYLNEDALSSSRASVKFDDSLFPPALSLKVGARVMLLKNISLRFGLVNGSVGEVVGFLHPLELIDLVLRAPRERTKLSARGRTLLARGGFLCLRDALRCVDTANGGALFWHLRQRGARSAAEVSYGEAYSGEHASELRRIAKLLSENEGEKEESESEREREEVHPYEMYAETVPEEEMRRTRLPIVRFDTQTPHAPIGKGAHEQSNNKDNNNEDNNEDANNETGQRERRLPRHVYACVSQTSHDWVMGEKVVATRTQIPLRHAWALTVHKSQGLTISHVEVAMHRFFSPGQAYVALSRCTHLENMRLLNFKDGCIRACPVAKKFYEELEKNRE